MSTRFESDHSRQQIPAILHRCKLKPRCKVTPTRSELGIRPKKLVSATLCYRTETKPGAGVEASGLVSGWVENVS